MAQHQFADFHVIDTGGDQQGAVIGHLKALDLQHAAVAWQAHERMRRNDNGLGQGQWAEQCRQQNELTHGSALQPSG
ncbi:hypothetical protein GCM10009085_14670 [Pseudomonas avellanae]|nr:hypothetical protein GCM10009085_14670 [Pseudomonas avellanae]